MRLTIEIPEHANLAKIFDFLVTEGAVIDPAEQASAVAAEKVDELLNGMREGMAILKAKKQGADVEFQSLESLLNELH